MKLVKPAYEEFCLPTKKYADVVIPRGAENEGYYSHYCHLFSSGYIELSSSSGCPTNCSAHSRFDCDAEKHSQSHSRAQFSAESAYVRFRLYQSTSLRILVADLNHNQMEL